MALSNLFLDTDVSLFYESMAAELAASPFSADELNAILKDEVAPVLGVNLLAVAGVWDGFDEEWLAQRIAASKGKWRWIPWHRAVARDWAAVCSRVSQLRQGAVE